LLVHCETCYEGDLSNLRRGTQFFLVYSLCFITPVALYDLNRWQFRFSLLSKGIPPTVQSEARMRKTFKFGKTTAMVKTKLKAALEITLWS